MLRFATTQAASLSTNALASLLSPHGWPAPGLQYIELVGLDVSSPGLEIAILAKADGRVPSDSAWHAIPRALTTSKEAP